MDGETTMERLVGELKTIIGDAEELLRATTSQAGEKIAVARRRSSRA